jgi:hypothetical protein
MAIYRLCLMVVFWAIDFDSLQAQTSPSMRMRFGFQGGLYLDKTDFFVGAHFRHHLTNDLFLSAPSFDYLFVEGDASFLSVNADLHYIVPFQSRRFWIGTGMGVGRFSSNASGDTDFLINLLSGVDFDFGPLTPFLQIKAVLFDDSQLVFSGGLTF